MFFTLISIIAVWPDSGKDHDAGLTSAELELEEKTEKDSITDNSITHFGAADNKSPGAADAVPGLKMIGCKLYSCFTRPA